MQRTSLALLIGSIAAAGLAACSSGDGSGGLLGRSTYGSGNGGPTTGTANGNNSSSSSGGSSSSSSGGGSSSSSSGGGSSSSSGGTVTTAPPPDAGPGSLSSQAHQFFDSTVYPEFASTCAPCHASGANGAPQMMTAPADTAYSQLDALGLIQSGSLLLSKGSHDNGAAPALTTQEQTDVETWLGMEAQERAGSAAPTNILQQVGMCVSETDWDNIGWKKLLTQPRTNENPNKCSGCNYALCASCHTSGEQGFYMDLGTAFDPDGSIAFQQSFTGTMMQSYVIQYFGLNGTTPIASNGIMNKQTAVATGAPYSHPMFVMPQTMVTALNTMVTNAITKYNAHECGGDAGASGDGGP